MTTAAPCSFPGCPRPAHAKGLCRSHRNQQAAGKELTPIGAPGKTPYAHPGRIKQHATPLEGCVHHWEIAANQGPYSLGVCKKCGEEKQFGNSIETTVGAAAFDLRNQPISVEPFEHREERHIRFGYSSYPVADKQSPRQTQHRRKPSTHA